MKKISIKLFEKKKALIISLLVVSLNMTSCQDYLDMPSYNAVDTETVFSDELTADMFVQGCYRGIIHSELFYQLGAGETVTHSSEDGTTNNSKYNICNYFYDATTPYTVTTIFKEQYRIIEATNIAISRMSKMPETAKTKALLGEAKAIRAFCYYNLIRVYGDVPAVWQPLEELNPDDENTFYPKRAPRDEIYDRIVTDLQSAVQDIPWFSQSGYATYERITKQGAYALLARVALHAGGYSLRWNLETNDPGTLMMSRRADVGRAQELYQIANDACEAVISRNENSLVQAQGNKSGFEYLWYNFCQRNFSATRSEMLWEVANLGQNTNSNFGVYAHPGTRGGVFGSRKALQFMLPTYYLSFNPNDTRRDVSCTAYSIYFLNNGNATTDKWVDVGTTLSCIMPGKFRISWCVEPQGAAERNVNIPVLRYADVLLMYAETQNYLNNNPTIAAKNALQEVRNRAGIGSLPIPSDKQGFEDAIVQERKWEFAGEFNLRTDLIRMNRLATELAATKQDMKDLSDRKNAYANTPVYRLYKFHLDAQTYGDPFLGVEYIDLTDPAEIALIQTIPTNTAQYANFLATTSGIAQAHGFTVTSEDKWYPVNMFQAYTSAYNGNSRKTVGFTGGFNTLQIGNIIYTKPTGSAENGGQYPNWIQAPDGSDGLYYGFQQNRSELLPFANKSAGHPLIDNPNLTQHPGYLN
ncbi:RagB/SusD family nutrient uptake outer membrane protein [Flavobacterium sp. ARAG 55.4]|uniref:RagB/SusD family nutrient uptake outer membrane protein n=1 Tax=Flavobacterium sp. ARAG 55.4 TaxID=3451357 RepID=UPI003F46EAD4